MPETQQPQIKIVLAEIPPVMAQVSPEAMEQMVGALQSARRIFVAGAGRSGLVMRMFAMRLMQMGRSVFVAGDATTPAIDEGDLLLVTSGSGNTATMQTLARTALACNASLALLTYSPGSSLAGLATTVLEIPVPLDAERPGGGGIGGAQPMASLFEQCALLTCDALAAALCAADGMSYAELAQRHANLE